MRVPLPAARMTMASGRVASEIGVFMVAVLASIFLQFPEGSGNPAGDG
jgi:hypothetical protein